MSPPDRRKEEVLKIFMCVSLEQDRVYVVPWTTQTHGHEQPHLSTTSFVVSIFFNDIFFCYKYIMTSEVFVFVVLLDLIWL